MINAVRIPVTVKCRIGIDDQDDEADLQNFVEKVAAAGCSTFIVHARKAWLQGLSPKENREIPPLNYDRVHRLKTSMPHLNIILNGGLGVLQNDTHHLATLDGLMYGREAYHNPWMLVGVDPLLANRQAPVSTRRQVIENMLDFIGFRTRNGVALHRITRHMLGLYHGQPGGRQWRRILSTEANQPVAGVEVLSRALRSVEEQATAHQDLSLAV
jgi:tRNA-dihydrouridine synthase A